jgi:hypothetical protein
MFTATSILGVLRRPLESAQYAAAAVLRARCPTQVSGILDRPVKPGDDSGEVG